MVSKKEFRQKKALANVAITLGRDILPGLVSNLASNEINKFERKISEKEALRAEKGFTLFVSNGYELYY